MILLLSLLTLAPEGAVVEALDQRLAAADRFAAHVSVKFYHAAPDADITDPAQLAALHDFDYPFFVQVARPVIMSQAELDRPERGSVPVIESAGPFGFVREHIRREVREEGYYSVTPHMNSGYFKDYGLLHLFELQFPDFLENGVHLRTLFERGLPVLIGEADGVSTYRAELPNGSTSVVCEFDLQADATPSRIKLTISAPDIQPITREMRVTAFADIRGVRVPQEAFLAVANPNVFDLLTVARVTVTDVWPDDKLTAEALRITPVPCSAKIVTARSDGFNESVTYDAEGRVTKRVIAGEAKILSGSGVAQNRTLSDRVFAVVGVGLIGAVAALGLMPTKRP